MSMTLGFVVRYDRAPSAPVPPTATPVVGARMPASAPQAVAPMQSAAQASWQPSADRFPAYASTTYGSHGEPNRPWVPSRTRLDLYA